MLLANLYNSEIFFFEDLVDVYRGEEVKPIPDPQGVVEDFVGAYSKAPDVDRGS